MASYGARVKKCGCLVAVCSAEPDYIKHAAKHVAKWTKRGLDVSIISDEIVRREFTCCEHKHKQLPLSVSPIGGVNEKP